MMLFSWAVLFLAATCALLAVPRMALLVLLAAAYGMAWIGGQIDLRALPALLLLVLAAGMINTRLARIWRYAGHALFLALALALGLHQWPGFHALPVVQGLRLSDQAAPFALFLNFDKPLAAFWLVLVLPLRQMPAGLRPGITGQVRAGLLWMLGSSLVCMAGAMLLGLVGWAPKLPLISWIWLLNNLLLVSFAEEALFRAYLQRGLRDLLQRYAYADTIAIGVVALLFGLAHAAGGWRMVVIAGLAGVGYGMAYRQGGLRAAVISHAGLNAIHFFCFTYPLLQPGS